MYTCIKRKHACLAASLSVFLYACIQVKRRQSVDNRLQCSHRFLTGRIGNEKANLTDLLSQNAIFIFYSNINHATFVFLESVAAYFQVAKHPLKRGVLSAKKNIYMRQLLDFNVLPMRQCQPRTKRREGPQGRSVSPSLVRAAVLRLMKVEQKKKKLLFTCLLFF